MKKMTSKKVKTKTKLLSEAKKQFIEKGFELTSIESVMASCGLTRGGFYSYFSSKSDLFNQAMVCQSNDKRESAEATINDLLKNIVDIELIAKDDDIIPLEFFSRVDNSEGTDAAYTEALRSTLDILMSHLKLDQERGEMELLSSIAMIVGAEVMSRNLTDYYLKYKLMESCERKLGKLSLHERNFDYLWEIKSNSLSDSVSAA